MARTLGHFETPNSHANNLSLLRITGLSFTIHCPDLTVIVLSCFLKILYFLKDEKISKANLHILLSSKKRTKYLLYSACSYRAELGKYSVYFF